jgi:hypothetical protein
MAVWGQEKWHFICAQDAMPGENALAKMCYIVNENKHKILTVLILTNQCYFLCLVRFKKKLSLH